MEMHGIRFLHDLAVVMITAGLVSLLFNRLKQPVVLGYILAGALIGPHTPPYPLIEDEETIHTLAQLGVIFLMFSLGMEFNLKKLKQVGTTAFIAAFLEILLMFFVGYEIGLFFKWNRMDSIFLGAMLSISSTTIIVKALVELGKTHEKFSSLIFGILIVEDILAIVMIALLSGIAMTGSLHTGAVLSTLGQLTVFLVTTLILGLIVVPRLISYVNRFKSHEMLLITVLALCFGVSLLAVNLGYSVALGAFLIGAIIAETKEIEKIEVLMAPLRDMFSAVFFVAIGLLIEPKVLVEYALPIVVITIAVVIGKILTCSLGTFVAGHSTRTSLKVGMGLAQIGEFSFIIASLGLSLKVTSGFLYPIAVTVSTITTLLTPYLIKSSDPLVAFFSRVAPESVTTTLSLYTRWVGQLGNFQKNNLVMQYSRKWLLQILLNAILLAGLFILGTYLAQHPPNWLLSPMQASNRNTLIWLMMAFISLPLFVATYRKLQALGMLITDMLPVSEDPSRKAYVQLVISEIIAVTGTFALVIFALILSSELLPPLKVLLAFLIILGVVTWFLWRTCIKVYAKAQVAIHETFSQKQRAVHENQSVHELFKDTELKSILISEKCPVAGRTIQDLQLRNRFGVNIVSIRRNGENLTNLSPKETILINDEIFLLCPTKKLVEVLNFFDSTNC